MEPLELRYLLKQLGEMGCRLDVQGGKMKLVVVHGEPTRAAIAEMIECLRQHREEILAMHSHTAKTTAEECYLCGRDVSDPDTKAALEHVNPFCDRGEVVGKWNPVTRSRPGSLKGCPYRLREPRQPYMRDEPPGDQQNPPPTGTPSLPDMEIDLEKKKGSRGRKSWKRSSGGETPSH